MLGNIAQALNSIALPKDESLKTSSNLDFVNAMASQNVHLNIQRIVSESNVIADMVESGEVKILGVIYDINSCKVLNVD